MTLVFSSLLRSWSSAVVSEWAKAVGCSTATADDFAEQEIDGATLVELEEDDLLRVSRRLLDRKSNGHPCFWTHDCCGSSLPSSSRSARPRRCSSTWCKQPPAPPAPPALPAPPRRLPHQRMHVGPGRHHFHSLSSLSCIAAQRDAGGDRRGDPAHPAGVADQAGAAAVAARPPRPRLLTDVSRRARAFFLRLDNRSGDKQLCLPTHGPFHLSIGAGLAAAARSPPRCRDELRRGSIPLSVEAPAWMTSLPSSEMLNSSIAPAGRTPQSSFFLFRPLSFRFMPAISPRPRAAHRPPPRPRPGRNLCAPVDGGTRAGAGDTVSLPTGTSPIYLNAHLENSNFCVASACIS